MLPSVYYNFDCYAKIILKFAKMDKKIMTGRH